MSENAKDLLNANYKELTVEKLMKYVGKLTKEHAETEEMLNKLEERKEDATKFLDTKLKNKKA